MTIDAFEDIEKLETDLWAAISTRSGIVDKYGAGRLIPYRRRRACSTES